MLSRTVDTRVPDGELPMNLAELKCANRHFSPAPGSADRFSETANLMVKMGGRLERRRV